MGLKIGLYLLTLELLCLPKWVFPVNKEKIIIQNIREEIPAVKPSLPRKNTDVSNISDSSTNRTLSGVVSVLKMESDMIKDLCECWVSINCYPVYRFLSVSPQFAQHLEKWPSPVLLPVPQRHCSKIWTGPVWSLRDILNMFLSLFLCLVKQCSFCYIKIMFYDGSAGVLYVCVTDLSCKMKLTVKIKVDKE